MRAKVVVRNSEGKIISEALGEQRQSVEFVLDDFKDQLRTLKLFNQELEFQFTIELTEEDKPHFST